MLNHIHFKSESSPRRFMFLSFLPCNMWSLVAAFVDGVRCVYAPCEYLKYRNGGSAAFRTTLSQKHRNQEMISRMQKRKYERTPSLSRLTEYLSLLNTLEDPQNESKWMPAHFPGTPASWQQGWKTTIRPHYIFHHTCVSGYPAPRPPRVDAEHISPSYSRYLPTHYICAYT